MLGRRLINTGGAACTTDTVQILDALKTESTALYRFEDNANDTASTSGKFGKGAIFSGSSSDTISTASSPLNFGTSDYSVSLWVNTRTLAANQALICPYDGNGLLVNIVQPNGYIRFYHNGGTLVNISTSAITANTWYHVCVTMDHSAAAKIYINGNLENTKTGSNLGTDPGGTFNIGNQPTHSSYYMQGRMDQVRVFNKALSQSEVTTLYNETTSTVNTLQVLGDTSCVATYTFEGNANDLSTNYNGTASGNITYDYSGTASNITYATGKFGKAAVFNGTDSRITIPAISAITGDVTFSVWANINSLSHTRRLRLIEINANSNGYAGSLTVMYKPSNGEFKIRAGNGTSSNSDVITHNYVLTADQWYHIAITRNNTTNVSKLYINNIEVDSETVSVNSSYPSNAQTFIGDYIGSSSYNYNWDGELDQIRIFNKALSSGEVNSLYNETATSAASATIDSPSTIAYYKMADASDETGSYNGTATNVDFNVQGKYGFAGKFNGSSSRINTGLTWPGGTEISCSLWINTAGGVNQYLLGGFNDSGANASNRFAFQFHNSNVLYILTNGAGGGLGTTTNAGSIASYLNKWTHIVVTVSGTEVKAYLDGSLFHTSTGTALAAGSHPFIIGAYTDNSSRQNVNGKIDQVRIFNKAISASEVTKLYNEIQCANTIATPESYFNTKLITPTTSSSALPVTGVGFAPGFAWAKYRGTGSGASTQSHYLVDTVRGITSRIFSNSTGQGTNDNYVQSFDSDGITYVNNLFNRTGANSVVGWFWKAASSDTTNNDGSITSTVRASQESGFSIVKYTGTGANATVGHGLNKPPSLIIVKPYGRAGDNWSVFNSISPNTQATFLNLNGTSQTPSSWGYGSGTFWNNTSPTSSVFSLGTIADTNASGIDIIAYCFANIDGYQRIGSYTGNGSAGGPFVYTGFEPAWLLIKRIDGGNSSWAIHDNKRATSNPRNKELFANLSDAESTFTAVDFLTNGFQIVNSNALYNNNGNTYLFLAIAANPDTTAPTKANSFKTVLYTGDDGTSRQLTGMGFKPDFTWIKQRNAVDNHALFDSVRGVNLSLSSNLVNVTNDRNDDSTKGVTSFDNDGVTLGSWNNVNANNDTYVAWNWKGLDHDRNLPAVNNDGSIISSVSANIAAGFSIVSYKGNATSGATVGHGLGAELDLLIVKSPNLTQAWNVYVKGVTTTNAQYFRLNESNSIYSTSNPRFIPANFNSNVFSIGSDNACNGNNDDYIAYCFKSISGYSKIGTYTISSSSDRVITGLGFTPSWVMVKRTDSTGSWVITDTSRLITKEIYADLSNAENTDSNGVQSFDSDGFTVGTGSWLGASGGTYIYMAFK